MDSEKIEYLKMIQEVIARMSTISSVVKGFSITASVALTAIMGCDFVQNWMLWIFLIPLLALMFLDIYYLSLEKKYRKLYEEVRTDLHVVDFSLELPKNIYNINFWDCFVSKSILYFHLPIMVMYLIVCIFGK